MDDIDMTEDNTRTTGACDCTECHTLGEAPNTPGETCTARGYEIA
ncbi:hypothetical protein [Curtobacterium sp. Leaf261]|nr:hypothetical protein [Curtobacterium sp. Leaf261]